jgi:hypothetical protein
LAIHLKSNRIWITVRWRDEDQHQYICHIHGFSDDHIELFSSVALPTGFPYDLACEIVDQYYETACICEKTFEPY